MNTISEQTTMAGLIRVTATTIQATLFFTDGAEYITDARPLVQSAWDWAGELSERVPCAWDVTNPDGSHSLGNWDPSTKTLITRS
jgi:hypothetical protein